MRNITCYFSEAQQIGCVNLVAAQPLLVKSGARLCFDISQWDDPKGEKTSEEAVDQGRGGAEKPHGKGCWDEASSIQEGEEETVKSDESVP